MELTKITEEQGTDFLTEERIDPDFWCDYNPEDYGFEVIYE